jgi:hypothetical protein
LHDRDDGSDSNDDIRELHSPHFTARLSAIHRLAPRVNEADVFEAFLSCLTDEDVLVIQEAARALVLGESERGLRQILESIATGVDSVPENLADVLFALFRNGYPLDERLRQVVSDEPPGALRNTALDLLGEFYDFNALFRKD